ncbi:YqaA family protein [Novosphingobium sp. MBES04]|uniref:YqaA family protein n=1 Tax=Novosphingobium sp. MBES04 TaxID=1206458 RepID=UPI00057D0FA5|nr:YqaA family protein [Novosphingobium sp. MBES04]GAM03921.1 cytochrome B561 [Novosphingobium sp. MBES04]
MLRRLYDWTMAKASHRHAERWLAGVSFVESSFFPIPPHPLLGLMCLAEPKKAVRFAAITTLASVLGGVFGYLIGYFLYDLVGEPMLAALGLAESFPKVRCYFQAHGELAVLLGAMTPLPFKLLTIMAGFMEMNFLTFVISALVGRGVIFMTVGVLFRLFGAPIKAIIDKHLGKVTALFGVLLVGGFAVLSLVGGSAKETQETCAPSEVSAPA